MGPESLGPVFETARLRLRPRGRGDLAACLAMDREPETTRWIAGPWADPVAHEAFVRVRIEAEHGEGLGYWVLSPREAPERFLGWVMLTPDGAGGIWLGTLSGAMHLTRTAVTDLTARPQEGGS